MKKFNSKVIVTALNCLINNLLKKSGIFQFFPTYWGLIPVKLEEKSATANNIEKGIYKREAGLF